MSCFFRFYLSLTSLGFRHILAMEFEPPHPLPKAGCDVPVPQCHFLPSRPLPLHPFAHAIPYCVLHLCLKSSSLLLWRVSTFSSLIGEEATWRLLQTTEGRQHDDTVPLCCPLNAQPSPLPPWIRCLRFHVRATPWLFSQKTVTAHLNQAMQPVFMKTWANAGTGNNRHLRPILNIFLRLFQST